MMRRARFFKPTMALLLAACIGSSSRAVAFSYEELPPPDYDAIARAAQRVDDGREYVDTLPDRLAECTKTAMPYASSPIIEDMLASEDIRITCLRAMMRKLGALYFEPDAFGSGGVDARIKELSGPLSTIFGFCCNVAMSLKPIDNYVAFMLDLTYLTAAYARSGRSLAEFREAWVKAAEFQ